MTVPPDVVEEAHRARDRVLELATEATDLNDHDRRAIALACRMLVETCEAARRRVDDCLRIEDDLGRRLNDLERRAPNMVKPLIPPGRTFHVESLEERLRRLRETVVDLPRREGESEYEYGQRKDALCAEMHALRREIDERDSESPSALAKAARALGA
jgi:hypothetical protein